MSLPMEAANLSFTEVDADQHRAFNMWHRYDHMPEQLIIEGVITGQRLVAAPDLLRRRYVADPELEGTRYFGYYLLSAPVSSTYQALADLYHSLNAKGRGFTRRGPSVGYLPLRTRSSPNVVSSAAVMPFRPHQGVYVTVDDPVGTLSAQDRTDALDRHAATEETAMLSLPGVAGCWTFEHTAGVGIPGTPYISPEGRVLRIYWLESEPSGFLDALDRQHAPGASPADGRYTSVLRCGYRHIPPNSAFDWFD